MATSPPHPQCSLPVASLSDGHRQKGREPGCGVGKLAHSLYHQGPSLSGDVQSGSARVENSFPTLTLAVRRWPQGEVYNVNHFEDGCCCVKMFAVQSLPDSNGNPVRASSNSLALVQNTYQYCAGIRHITTLFSPRQNYKTPILRMYMFKSKAWNPASLTFYRCTEKQTACQDQTFRKVIVSASSSN